MVPANYDQSMVLPLRFCAALVRSEAKLAGPAMVAAGGRFLARGNAAKAYEKGVVQRVVILEFDSIEKAVAAHDGPGYQAALKVLGNAAERDIRIVEALA